MSSEDKLKPFIDLVIDGKEINWHDDSNETSEIKQELKQLRMLDELAKAFAARSKGPGEGDNPDADPDASATDDTVVPLTEHQTDCLFEWGHLRALEQIGEGAYGQVYRAYDTVLDRNVALKLRHPAHQAETLKNAAFIEEARRLAQVRHPNVLAVHGADIFDDRVGLWSDLLTGETLAKRLAAGDSLKTDTVQKIALSLCRALSAVHGAGLVHGDIKSSNVMIEPDGQIMLMDFGAGTKANVREPRRIGTPIYGTPQVMAPELFAGASQTPACDMYSVGVLLFRLLAGRYPIEAKTVQEIGDYHDAKIQPRLKGVKQSVSKPLAQLTEQLLDRNPQQRPTAAQTSDRLEWIIEIPRRRARRLAVYTIFGALTIGFLAYMIGYFNSRAAEKETRIALQKEETIRAFLFDTFRSASPLMEGKDIKVVDVLDNAADRLKTDFLDQPQVRGALYFTLGDTYRQLGEQAQAISLLSVSDSIWTAELGPENESSLASRLALTSARRVHGITENAEAQYRSILQLAETHLPPGHHVTVETRMRLADHLNGAGELVEADSLIRAALQFRLNDPRRDRQLRIFGQVIQGNILLARGDYSGAESVLSEVVDIEDPNSTDDPNVLAARSGLAVAYVRHGKFSDAERLMREILANSTRVLGEEHRSICILIGNLGNVLQEQAKYDEAALYLKRALELSQELYGEKHVQTLSTMGNLANVIRQQGNLIEAERLLRRAVELMGETLGAEHPSTLMYEYNLAELLNLMGRHEDAERLARETWQAQITVMGEKHHFTLESRDMMGVSLRFLGQLERAEAIHREVWRAKTDLLGPDNPYTIATRNNLADVLLDSRNYSEAETLYREVIEKRSELLGSDHPETVKSTQGLIETLRAVGRDDEAERLQSGLEGQRYN